MRSFGRPLPNSQKACFVVLSRQAIDLLAKSTALFGGLFVEALGCYSRYFLGPGSALAARAPMGWSATPRSRLSPATFSCCCRPSIIRLSRRIEGLFFFKTI